MTLDEAINHAINVSKSNKCSKDCRKDHAQLAHWLKELKSLKAKQSVKRYSWEDTHPNYDIVLKSQKKGSGKIPVAYRYTDDNGVKHWKTGWYSNRSGYIDDFKYECHGGEQ